jgi:hypothetical protein
MWTLVNNVRIPVALTSHSPFLFFYFIDLSFLLLLVIASFSTILTRTSPLPPFFSPGKVAPGEVEQGKQATSQPAKHFFLRKQTV